MLDLLFRQKALNTNSFALCFGHDDGYMTLGGYRTDKHLAGEEIQKIKYFSNYEVSIKSVRVQLYLCRLARRLSIARQKYLDSLV